MNINNLLQLFIHNSQRVTIYQIAMSELLAAFGEFSVVRTYSFVSEKF